MQKVFLSKLNTFHFFLILVFLFFGNSIRNNYSLDDSYVTVTNYPIKGNEKNFKPNNELVAKGIKGISKIWHSHYGHGKGTNYDYRPLTLTMFAIEYSLWGQSPHIDHFINLIVYTLLVFYLFLFIKKILRDYPYSNVFALICSVLFLAHPIHTEVVNNIKCRDELLALLFVVLSFHQVLLFDEEKKIKHIVYAFIFIALGFYCKFSAILAFVLIPLIAVFFTKIKKVHIAFIIGGFFIFYFLYRKLRHFMLLGEEELRVRYHFENPLYTEHTSFLGLIVYSLKTFGIYVKLLLFPNQLRFYYGYPLQTVNQSFFDFEIILGIAFVFFACWYCYKKKDKIAFFGLLFFLLSISPLVNFIKPVAGIVGERLCFISTIGFTIFVVAVLFSLYKTAPSKLTLVDFTQKPLLYLTIVLFIFLIRDWTRNKDWKSEFSLYEHDMQYEPKSGGGSNLLGNKYYELLRTGDNTYSQPYLIAHTLDCYHTAYSTDSTLFSAFNNAGALIFGYKGQYEEAYKLFKLGIKFNPDPYPQAYENIGNYFRKKNNFQEAFKNYRIATLQSPKQYNSYKLMLDILVEKKAPPIMLSIVKEANTNFPNDYLFTSQYGNYYLINKDTLAGLGKLEEAYTINPNKKLAEYLYARWLERKDSLKSDYYRQQYAVLPQ